MQYKKKNLLLLAIASIFLNASRAQLLFTPDSLLAALARSFKAKDVSSFRAFLAADFSVGVYNRPAAEGMLQTVFERYPFDSLRLQKIETRDGKKRIAFLVFSKGKAMETAAYINSHNELLYADLFDQLYGVNNYQPSVLKARIPFELVNGSIVVTARLNNSSRPLHLLFDTGADGMALKKSIADSLGLTVSRKQTTSVVGRSMEVAISSGNTLYLDTMAIPDNNIALFESIGKNLDGILGITLARRFITKVDFDKQIMELYSFGNYTFEEEGTTVALTLPGGVPVIPVAMKVGEKEVEGRFIFDTGAGYYLIGFGPFVKKHLLLTSGFVPYFSGSTVSMGHASASFTGNFDQLTVGTLQLRHFLGVLQAYQPGDEKWAGEGSGSLGIKTLRRFNFTLNLAEHLVHFTPNKASRLPYDFVISGVYFSFDKNGQLVVESVMDEKAAAQIQPGDVVASINNLKAVQLAGAPDKIKQLLSGAEKGYTLQLEREGAVQKVQL